MRKLTQRQVTLGSLDDIRTENYHFEKVISSRLIAPKIRFFSEIGEGSSSSFIRYGSQIEPLNDIEGFFASLRFEQRVKLDQLGTEIGSFD